MKGCERPVLRWDSSCLHIAPHRLPHKDDDLSASVRIQTPILTNFSAVLQHTIPSSLDRPHTKPKKQMRQSLYCKSLQILHESEDVARHQFLRDIQGQPKTTSKQQTAAPKVPIDFGWARTIPNLARPVIVNSNDTMMLPNTCRQLGELLEHGRLALYITLAGSNRWTPMLADLHFSRMSLIYLYIPP